MQTEYKFLTPYSDADIWLRFLNQLYSNSGNDQMGGPDWAPLPHEHQYGLQLKRRIVSRRLIVLYKEVADNDILMFSGLDDLDYVRKRARFIYLLPNGIEEKKVYNFLFQNVLKYAFECLNFRRLTAFLPLGSNNIQTTLSSFGFKKEGILREYIGNVDKYEDIVIYGILRNECLLNFG